MVPVRSLVAAAVAALAPVKSFAAGPIAAPITKDGTAVSLTPIASGLSSPTDMEFESGGARAFLATLDGTVRLVKNGDLQTTPVLDLSATTLPSWWGMTGLALDPDFSNAASVNFGKFYVLTCEAATGTPDYNYGTNHQGVLYEYRMSTVNPDVADLSTKREVLRVGMPPGGDHHLNDILFGQDGMLYLSAGDGGNSAGNPAGNSINGQDMSKLLGKVLRIDPHGNNAPNGKYGIPNDNPFVSTAGARAEIYALGFRNPYRLTVDRQNGDLWVGDVGQISIEEVNKVVAGGNYGWAHKEGTFAYNATNQSISTDLTGVPAGLIDPVAQYDHDEGSCVITGFVYRGSLLPHLQGKMIFGDYVSSAVGWLGRLWYMDPADGIVHEMTLAPTDGPLGFRPLGFAEDPDGELYLHSEAGGIYALTPRPGDATISGWIDADDYFAIDRGYARGLSGWENGDFNRDRMVDADDYAIIDAAYAQQGPAPGSAAIPEPGALGGVGLSALLMRRNRRRPNPA